MERSEEVEVRWEGRGKGQNCTFREDALETRRREGWKDRIVLLYKLDRAIYDTLQTCTTLLSFIELSLAIDLSYCCN